MPISFTCPHCGAQSNVADEYAGQTGPCASCGASITIPGEPAATAGTGGMSPVGRSSSPSRAVIVLAVVAVVSLFCCGGMVALLLPAVQAAREAARRAECANAMKNLALAMHEYHDTYKSFPPAYLADENGQPMHSWRVLLLPYVEEAGLYAQYDFNEPWDGPNNRLLADLISNVYRCPSDPGSPVETCFMVITGPGTMFEGTEGTKIPDVTDGTSNTLLIVEVAGSGTNWMEPVDLDITTMDLFISNANEGDGISSYHPGGVNAALADASVRFLVTSTPEEVIESLITKDAGD